MQPPSKREQSIARQSGVRVGLAVWVGFLLMVVACGSAATTSPQSSFLALERNYWDKTSPLIERAVLEGGTSLSQVYLAHYRGITEGRLDDWEPFVHAVNVALPVYEEVLAEWLKIQPPSVGQAAELHRAYGLAWGERVRSLTLISAGWVNDDDEALQDGLARMDSASALGRDAERLRVQFNTHLLELCTIHRLPECK